MLALVKPLHIDCMWPIFAHLVNFLGGTCEVDGLDSTLEDGGGSTNGDLGSSDGSTRESAGGLGTGSCTNGSSDGGVEGLSRHDLVLFLRGKSD